MAEGFKYQMRGPFLEAKPNPWPSLGITTHWDDEIVNEAAALESIKTAWEEYKRGERVTLEALPDDMDRP